MYTLDASAIVYLWDNYPPNKFGPLWDWIENQIETGEITIPIVAIEEVEHVSPDCQEWLVANEIQIVALSQPILDLAVEYKNMLGIINDNFHPKGVDENDLLIIATASNSRKTLISEEAVQSDLPNNQAKYKIPAVCQIANDRVPCVNIIDLIRTAPDQFR